MPRSALVWWLNALPALGLLAFSLAGCASEITLRHQFTGQTAECRGSPFSQALVRCLEHHEREGYRRVPQ
jgi:hypothetical protein